MHALLSLHSSAMALADLSTSPHPVASLHVGLRQMSLDVQAAPMSVVEHSSDGLHVYVVHWVSDSHGVSAFT